MNNQETIHFFTIYWLDGKRSVLKGYSIDNAFNEVGYGWGAVKAVDWYDNGITYTHEYNKQTKKWDKLETPYQDFTVYWPDGKREFLAGTDIKHALKRAGCEDYELITMSVWEDGITDNYLYFPLMKEWVLRTKLDETYMQINMQTERPIEEIEATLTAEQRMDKRLEIIIDMREKGIDPSAGLNKFVINSAIGNIYDEIGKILTQNGKEDASGARRCILELIREDNLVKAAQMLGCEEQQVFKLRQEFTCAASQQFLKQSHT